MKSLSRRSVMAGSAAAVTAIPSLALPVAAREGGELAALVRRYFAEVDAFNADPPEDNKAYFATQPQDLSLRAIGKTAVRTKQDALAVLEFMEREDVFTSWCGCGEGVIESLTDGLRAYIEGRSA